MIRRKRKPHEPREVKQPRRIIWKIIAEDDFHAQIDGYDLRVERLDEFNFYFGVYFGKDEIAHSDFVGTKTTAQQAKNAAVFQMNKHKKSLIRKIINHG